MTGAFCSTCLSIDSLLLSVRKSDPPSSFNHTNDNHVQMEVSNETRSFSSKSHSIGRVNDGPSSPDCHLLWMTYIRRIDGSRLQSDYDVCVECGSLAECEHDREMGSTTVLASIKSNVHPLSHGGSPTSSEIDYLEMRTVQAIPPLSEVFNTYGSLSNAALLSRYGFMLPENEYDTVRMVFDPPSTVRKLFEYVGLGDASVGEDDYAVMEASMFGHLEIRNTFRVSDFTDHGGADCEPHL